jgi:hypothetical protein
MMAGKKSPENPPLLVDTGLLNGEYISRFLRRKYLGISYTSGYRYINPCLHFVRQKITIKI